MCFFVAIFGPYLGIFGHFLDHFGLVTTIFSRDRFRYFFPGPIFSRTGTDTFFRDHSGTGIGTIKKGAKFPGPGCHTLVAFFAPHSMDEALRQLIEVGLNTLWLFLF